MTRIKISKESLIHYGFEETFRNDEERELSLMKKIVNPKDPLEVNCWYVSYDIYNQGLEDEYEELYIEANGGHSESGEFDLSHFEYIDQIESLIDAMLLTNQKS